MLQESIKLDGVVFREVCYYDYSEKCDCKGVCDRYKAIYLVDKGKSLRSEAPISPLEKFVSKFGDSYRR